ncbi:MAG: response regulator [Deltaproteobacteria bacterium]|nr:response regulator [Deltaproteobacteria bacterium]MCB9788099.1 response regulator [Deltaproteobacteria bacterium]
MAQARILYVDDDLELTQLVKGYLEQEGYEVLIANDGEEGLGAILTEDPDLVILDVMMPQLNGWEIAKYMRERDVFDGVPILMLTGIGPALNEMTAPLYGANAHLDKPFELDDLVEKVGELLALGDE